MAGIKKLGCLGVLSRKTSKNPQKDESYQEGFRTDPYIFFFFLIIGRFSVACLIQTYSSRSRIPSPLFFFVLNFFMGNNDELGQLRQIKN